MKEFTIGEKVRLSLLYRLISKRLNRCRVLRPADILQIGEEGTVLDRRPGGYWGVRFLQGAFLLDDQYLEPI